MFFLFKIKAKEIPIKIYKVVQTGAKRKLGGEKLGFCKVAYHPGIAGVVKIDPTNPAARQTKIETINLTVIKI